MKKVADLATVPAESYVNIRRDITADEVVAAMQRLEEIVEEAAHDQKDWNYWTWTCGGYLAS